MENLTISNLKKILCDFYQINQTSPRTTYLKLLDIWGAVCSFGCVLIVVAVLVVYRVMVSKLLYYNYKIKLIFCRDLII